MLGHFANLIPLNKPAKRAIQATLDDKSATHAHQYIARHGADHCFALSLGQLPEFPRLGWRIGRGRRKLPRRGVDLLLRTAGGGNDDDGVAGVHATLSWRSRAAGFFVTAEGRRGATLLLNGEAVARGEHRIVPRGNTIGVGECLFRLEYVGMAPREEETFQVQLRAYVREFCGDENPFILPTPKEHDASFGEWNVQWAISRGAFGTVYMVVHSRSGQPAAAKHLLKTNRNGSAVDREIRMATRISQFSHSRIACPIDIIPQGRRTKVEMDRMRALLEETWLPASANEITDAFIILSPLSSTTLSYVCAHLGPGAPGYVGYAALATLFAHLLEALTFLHARGISHRDVKPDNVLVSGLHPPRAVLTDFGCASDAAVIEYERVGTVAYLAPELVPGRTHTRAVDLWAAGLVGCRLMGLRVGGARMVPGERAYEDCIERLGAMENVVAQCSRRMLAVEPCRRMSPVQAGAALRKFLEPLQADVGEKRRLAEVVPGCLWTPSKKLMRGKCLAR